MKRALAAGAVLAFVMLAVVISPLLGTGASASATVLTPGTTACTLPGDSSVVGGLDPDQVANANAIISVGVQYNVPTQGIAIALATAMQESTLHNLDHGDRDSLGLFQQRPWTGWGTPAQIQDPTLAARAFFGVADHTHNRGLLGVPGWESMPLWQAAQAVQASGFPMAYAKWETLGTTLAGGGVECTPGTGTGGGMLPGNTVGERAVNAALTQLGLPYSWGGGGPEGPSYGFAQGAPYLGFDCSSLMQYGWFQAAGIRLPRVTDDQAKVLTPVTAATAQAGDLILFTSGGTGGGGFPHVGMYDGQGGMVHAPRTGKNVERVANVFTDSYYAPRIGLIGRPSIPNP